MHWRRQHDDVEAYEWSEIQYTRQLVRHARDCRVPIPPRQSAGEVSEYWHLSPIHGEWHLTVLGESTLRDGIRAEVRWRREQRAHYIAWVVSTVGVLGALTGLVATFRHP